MNLQLTVVDNTGAALMNVSAILEDLAGNIINRLATNSSGVVIFSVEEDTSWQISLSKVGYCPYTLLITMENSNIDMTVTLYPLTVTRLVSITCVDSITYLPIAGAIGTLVGIDTAATKAWTDQNDNCQAITNSLGLYQYNVISGIYEFTLVAAGYDTYNITVDTTSGPVTEMVTITMATNVFPLVIQVMSEGLGVQGATVYIYDEDENNGPFVLTTDSSGSAHTIVYAGTYIVYISAAGYQTSFQTVTIPGS
jgi:hypothetical protein